MFLSSACIELIFHAKTQRSQRRKGGSIGSGASESLTRLCVFAIFASLREILLSLLIHFEYCEEGFLRDFDAAHFLHPLLAFFLLL